MRVPRSRRRGRWLRAWLAATAVAAVALPLAGSAVPASPGRTGGVGADDRRVLGLAEQLLTRECMRRAGFELWVVPPAPADQLRSFPYVVDDVAWARAHGFGTDLVAATDERRRADPNQRYFAALPAERRVAALAALNGARPEGLEARVPSGGVVRRSADGCTSEAQRQLYGDLPAWYRTSKVVANLSYLRQRRVLADPAWTAALRSWSRCVRQQGYPVDTPDQLREAVVTRGRAAEVAAAVTEARCAAGGLAATARELDARHRADLTAAYRREVATRERLEQAAVPRARAVVAAESARR
ncbi:hypothetical protein AB0L34_17490 [Micromonospora sp. NPDC052213]|uniref:hypothetical protein n=1 Tax=Micromonospora sp. NPDC052213 TaxID=3155812 RepID=UPI00342314C2